MTSGQRSRGVLNKEDLASLAMGATHRALSQGAHLGIHKLPLKRVDESRRLVFVVGVCKRQLLSEISSDPRRGSRR